VADRAVLSAAKDVNYTAERVLRVLEVIVFAPSSPPQVAAAIGIHPRTARRMLRTLVKERYVERRGGRGRAAHTYLPTVRLLALAAQLAPRLPLVENGRRTTRELHDATGLTAYLAIPSYDDVLVIARAGERGPQLWALMPAADDAAGHLLLAHSDAWRHSQTARGTASAEQHVELIRARGYASVTTKGAGAGSLASAVAAPDRPPFAALAIQGPSHVLLGDERALAELLRRTAAKLARRAYVF
jgi:DNA-binding IclR family transcriptional regulator